MIPAANLDDIFMDPDVDLTQRTEAEMCAIFRSAKGIIDSAVSLPDGDVKKKRIEAAGQLLKDASMSDIMMFDIRAHSEKGVEYVYKDNYIPIRTRSLGSENSTCSHFQEWTCVYPATCGFFAFDSYRQAAPDSLHVLDSGLIGNYLLNEYPKSCRVFRTCLQSIEAQPGNIIRKINDYLWKLEDFVGKIRIPTEGISASKRDGYQNVSLLAVIGPALLTWNEFTPLVECIAGEYAPILRRQQVVPIP